MTKTEKPKNKRLEKALKVLSKSWVDNHTSISVEQSKNEIYEAELQIRSIEEKKKDDPNLNDAKEIVKDLGSGYKDAIAYERAKIMYLVEKLEGH
jgi:hypothetical protein